jgi:tellurite resistance protein
LHEVAEELAEDPIEAEGAFALAAALALADDDVSDEENAFINQLAEWFGISSERATEILDQLAEDRELA